MLALVAGGAGNACCNDTVADGVKLFATGFLQTLGRCLTVDSVDHYLLGLDLLDDFQPGTHKFFASIVDVERSLFESVALRGTLNVEASSHKHCLDDDVPVKGLHVFDNLLDIVGACGAVYLINIGGVYGVELQDVVVDTQ